MSFQTNHHKINLAEEYELDEILKFIEIHWNANHIFVNHPEIFKYEYSFKSQFNFLLARDKENNNIEGVMGFYKYSSECPEPDICVSFWKVKKTSDPFLGVQILNSIKSFISYRSIFCIGINKETLPIYNYLGFQTGALKHYFRLNEKLRDFKIAVFHGLKNNKDLNFKSSSKLKKFDDIEALLSEFNPTQYKDRFPFKDQNYIEKRYYLHPVYHYKVFGISSTEKLCNSIIIMREVCLGDRKALRVVDFIGSERDLIGISDSIDDLLIANNYEYMDFYQLGISNEIMKQAGFKLKELSSNIVIPNYFEPFIQSNIELKYFCIKDTKTYLFKGDGDQDRPNIFQQIKTQN